ncbi:hypothetical protein Tco_0442723 [Tanacetum coccineum]
MPRISALAGCDISALKELLKQQSNHDLIIPMLLNFNEEIQDTDDEGRKDDRVKVDELSFYTLFRAFGKHLEEIHVTWAHFGKKQDEDATLQAFYEALNLQCMETVS